LEARPTADKCIDCKTLDEIKEKQLGSWIRTTDLCSLLLIIRK
jgi:hypothetical protein